MSTEIENKPKEGEETPDTAKELEALKKQIDNLNKGIAKYRDEAKVARDEIAKTKAEHDAKIQELTKKNKVDEEDLPDLSTDDQKRLEKWAKAQGFVTKSEFEAKQTEMQRANLQTIEKEALDEFLGKHPEYEEDENWAKLKSEFALYRQPSTVEEYRKILSKVHSSLNPDDSKARAEATAKSRLSLGGGSQKGNEPASNAMDELQKKYPNLTRDQIAMRLKELDTLFPKKK